MYRSTILLVLFGVTLMVLLSLAAPTASTSVPPPVAPTVTLTHNSHVGDLARVERSTTLDIVLSSSTGETARFVLRMNVTGTEEVLVAENGRPVEVRHVITDYKLTETDNATLKMKESLPLPGPAEVKVDRSVAPPVVEKIKGRLPGDLVRVLSEHTALTDLLPADPVKVGDTFTPAPETMDRIRDELHLKPSDALEVTLTLDKLGPVAVLDGKSFDCPERAREYVLDAAEMSVTVRVETAVGVIPAVFEASGKYTFAVDAGVCLGVVLEGTVALSPVEITDAYLGVVTITGKGTYRLSYAYHPIEWKRGVMVTAVDDTSAVRPR